jgi:hypothetical protein
LLGDLRIVRRYKVRKHQCLDACPLCHASGIFGRRLARDDAALERGCVRYSGHQSIDGWQVNGRMDENVSPFGELDRWSDRAVSPEITIERSSASNRYANAGFTGGWSTSAALTVI